MTIKKGIVVRSGATAVHRLDDKGEFNLGENSSGNTITLNATQVDIKGSTSAETVLDVATALSGEERKIAVEAAKDSGEYDNMETKIDNIEAKLHGGDALTWTNAAAAATTFAEADVLLAAEASRIKKEFINLGNTSPDSIKARIAEVIWGDATKAADVNGAAVLDTVGEIADALLNTATVSGSTIATLDEATVRADLLTYLNGRKSDLLNNAGSQMDTLLELDQILGQTDTSMNTLNGGNVASEMKRHHDLDTKLDTRFANTAGASALQASGIHDAGEIAAGNYMGGAATRKAADEKLADAITNREKRMDELEGTADAANGFSNPGLKVGTLTVTGASILGDLSFTQNTGRFQLPTMDGDDAATQMAGKPDGSMVYVINGASSGSDFLQANKLYIKEDGVWFASSFRSE